MREFYPLLIIGAIIGVLSIIFLVAYVTMKDKKEAIGFDRHMKDSEIVRRLMKYAKPQWKSFVLVLLLMVFSIVYDIVSPLIIGNLTQSIEKDTFTLRYLYTSVAAYGSILAVSMLCTYVQAIVLQKTGQRILSAIREDLFVHIESLSHEQLNHIPVG